MYASCAFFFYYFVKFLLLGLGPRDPALGWVGEAVGVVRPNGRAAFLCGEFDPGSHQGLECIKLVDIEPGLSAPLVHGAHCHIVPTARVCLHIVPPILGGSGGVIAGDDVTIVRKCFSL